MCAAKKKVTKNPATSALAENLRRLRRAKGWSQADLATHAAKWADKGKMDRSTITNIENGSRGDVRAGTLRALATALECSVADLTGNAADDVIELPVQRREVRSGVAHIAELLPRYIASPLFLEDAPTPEELQWLSRFPAVVWRGDEPDEMAIHDLIAGRREGKF